MGPKKGGGPPRSPPCGPWPVPRRFPTGLTSEDDVSRQAWRDATLARCPLHPPWHLPAAQATGSRWSGPEGHRTFSLLPDRFAAQLPGTRCAVEAVVAEVEWAKSLEAAADILRPDIELPGALRWTPRRARAGHAARSRAEVPPTLRLHPLSLRNDPSARGALRLERAHQSPGATKTPPRASRHRPHDRRGRQQYTHRLPPRGRRPAPGPRGRWRTGRYRRGERLRRPSS